MNIRLDIVGFDTQVARLKGMGDRVPVVMRRAMNESVHLIHSKVMEEKLLGQVLNRRTGNLLRNIRSEVVQIGLLATKTMGLLGRVFVGSGAPYGKIHEFGGTVQIPEIVPKNKKALRFFVGNNYLGTDVIFARKTRAHPVTIPQRSFLRSTLKERAEDVKAIFQKWVNTLTR